MPGGSTTHESSAATPWGSVAGDSARPGLHLALAWSLEEPHRIGEVADVAGPRVLGRGEAQDEDPAPRARFVRQRPMGTVSMPPLTGPRLSRLQLELRPQGADRLEVRSVGRCPLTVNGVPTARAVLQIGDTLSLRSSLVAIVVQRPRQLEPLRFYEP